MKPLQIIHLEDNLTDAALLEATLQIEQIDCKIMVVNGRQEFQSALTRTDIDLILSDFSMPRLDGLTALQMAQSLRPEVPFIFFSGTIGEELAVEALREGATDYVLKDRTARLPTAIRRALAEVEARNQRQRDVEQLRNQAALLDLAQDAICVTDMEQTIGYWNKSAERMYGWSAAEAMGLNANQLLFQGKEASPHAAIETLLRDDKWQGELHQVTKCGKNVTVESRWTLMRNEQGKPKSILVINTDVTEKKEIEARFLRTQRVETIGALAGGIAHDLNNSLTPVLVALHVLGREVSGEDNKKMLDVAQASAWHSVDMIKQILSFSRGVGGAPVQVQVEQLVNDVVKFIQDTFPCSIEIQSKIGPELSQVNGNSTQLHQVLLNLCVNARDAMPEGGSLCLEAVNVFVDEAEARGRRQASGPYVLLTATDTGHGMSPEVLAKIFEPFFTTKEIGKGTGLGLSTVIGIVKTHGGFMDVSSEVGKGASFKVYLPAMSAPVDQSIPKASANGALVCSGVGVGH